MPIDSHNKQCSSIEGNENFTEDTLTQMEEFTSHMPQNSLPDSLAARDDHLTQFKPIKRELRDNMFSFSV